MFLNEDEITELKSAMDAAAMFPKENADPSKGLRNFADPSKVHHFFEDIKIKRAMFSPGPTKSANNPFIYLT